MYVVGRLEASHMWSSSALHYSSKGYIVHGRIPLGVLRSATEHAHNKYHGHANPVRYKCNVLSTILA